MNAPRTPNSTPAPPARHDHRLTDAGLETVLIFEHGFELPEFAAFPLLDDERGRSVLHDYYRGFADIAAEHGVDLVLDTPTWRASQSWGAALGYDAQQLTRLNTAAVDLVDRVRRECASDATEITISGCVGPRGDGYQVTDTMTAAESAEYHSVQVDILADAGVDVVTVLTMTYVAEAVGVATAARSAGVPVVVSFTVETDGRLPSGETLRDAVHAVDRATDGYPKYYGINCAHPDHFEARLDRDESWCSRIGLIRANASRMSHEELDNAEQLDAGTPSELGQQYAELYRRLDHLDVLGGCCGTSHVHLAEITSAVGASR